MRKTIERDPGWQDALRSVSDLERVVAFEVLDGATGTVLGRVPVDPKAASLSYARVVATRDRLFVLERRGRLVAYSFEGKVAGRLFASGVTAAADGERIAVRTALGRLVVLDARTFEQLAELQFASAISLVSFGGDSRTMFVVTSDQTMHTFDVAGCRCVK